MGLISNLFYFFTPYTDATERAVGRFFKRLSERGSQSRTRARLDPLLQHNIAVINLWTEYQYKGYRYLTKAQRKKLYANMQLIAEDFDRFYTNDVRSPQAAISQIQSIAPQATIDPQKAVLLQALTYYFSPKRGLYVYRESSSFGRLLRDPAQEKLIGDCNQIVTLYIYLYSRYYTVSDLRIRLLPGHVALHYAGIDIETTNGTFADYSKREGNSLLPIEEIVSINLLDTTDSYLSTHEVAAKDFLQAARFASILSHDHDIARRNLHAAYSNAINALMKNNNFKQALQFAVASRDRELLAIVGNNGAVYEMKRHNYPAARRFASHAANRDELIKSIWQAEGIYHLQAERYHNAIKAFKKIDDQTLIRQSYTALFFQEQKKLGTKPTIETIRQRHMGTIKRMHTYAKKSRDKKLLEYMNDLQKNL
ncbi:MAG TPA: hypothetical protein VF733_01930 [Candidatus Saccharimonadales bacterium]